MSRAKPDAVMDNPNPNMLATQARGCVNWRAILDRNYYTPLAVFAALN
jgi:hypothetical protein